MTAGALNAAPAGEAAERLGAIADKARDYARNARAENTRRAYDSDWRQFSSWLRRQGFAALPPDPQTVGLYLAACAGLSVAARNIGGDGSGRGAAPVSVTTLERRLSGIAWRYRQLGKPLDTQDRHIGAVLAGIRRTHGRPPVQKEAIFAEDLLAMLSVLENDLRGLRDRAILAIGFAGALRRSEITGLDCGPDQSEDGTGWIELFGSDVSRAVTEGGLLLTINGKTGWREVEIGRGSSALICPVAMLETWMRLGRISDGALFRRVAKKNAGVTSERLTDKHVARLVQKTALAAGIRGDLPEGERKRAFAGHSARRPRQLRANRGGPCSKASWPRQRRNDPAIPAQTRQIQSQSHQGGRVVKGAR